MRKTFSDILYGTVAIFLAVTALYYNSSIIQQDKEHVSIVVEDVPLIVTAGL